MSGLDTTSKQTAIQNHAIRTLLSHGLQQEDILTTVRLHTGATRNQFFDLIAPIAAIPSEPLLLARIEAIVNEYPTDLVGLPVNSWHTNFSSARRDDQTGDLTLHEPLPFGTTTAKTPSGPAARKKHIVRRPCPGDNCNWLCLDRPADGRENWQSLKPFEKHFIAKHIQSYRDDTGAYATCNFCWPPITFNGDGAMLVDHLWKSHMDPYLNAPVHSAPGVYPFQHY